MGLIRLKIRKYELCDIPTSKNYTSHELKSSNQTDDAGTDIIRELFRQSVTLGATIENRIFSLLRWIKTQVTHCQHLKKAG